MMSLYNNGMTKAQVNRAALEIDVVHQRDGSHLQHWTFFSENAMNHWLKENRYTPA